MDTTDNKLYYIQNLELSTGEKAIWWTYFNGYTDDISKAWQAKEILARSIERRHDVAIYPVEYIDNIPKTIAVKELDPNKSIKWKRPKRILRNTLTVLLLFLVTTTQAQVWKWSHFGVNSRISSASPFAPMIGGCLNTAEGVASISDPSGNFLFATDGVTIYDRNCSVMANGTALLGGSSSTQSAVIGQDPGNPNKYYVFTCSQDVTPPGICYSVVDMTLGGGLGAVTVKNISLTPGLQMSEKLCIVEDCNAQGFWVVGKRFGNPDFHSWHVDALGVSPAVISSCGYTPSGVTQNGYGQLKANPQGTRLAAAYYGANGAAAGNRVELYDFNKDLGTVSNAVSLGTINGAYGCEFSMSGSFLYASTNQGSFYQWDLCNQNQRTLLGAPGAFGGSLQLQEQGHILCSRGTNAFLGVIRYPDLPGSACTFIHNFIPTTGASRFGLPPVDAGLLVQDPDTFTWTSPNCNTLHFNFSPWQDVCNPEIISNILWTFGDGSLSVTWNPVHTYQNPGTYVVVLTAWLGCRSFSITENVTVPAPVLPPITMQ